MARRPLRAGDRSLDPRPFVARARSAVVERRSARTCRTTPGSRPLSLASIIRSARPWRAAGRCSRSGTNMPSCGSRPRPRSNREIWWDSASRIPAPRSTSGAGSSGSTTTASSPATSRPPSAGPRPAPPTPAPGSQRSLWAREVTARVVFGQERFRGRVGGGKMVRCAGPPTCSFPMPAILPKEFATTNATASCSGSTSRTGWCTGSVRTAPVGAMCSTGPSGASSRRAVITSCSPSRPGSPSQPATSRGWCRSGVRRPVRRRSGSTTAGPTPRAASTQAP